MDAVSNTNHGFGCQKEHMNLHRITKHIILKYFIFGLISLWMRLKPPNLLKIYYYEICCIRFGAAG
jgi:hypothetical protein